MKGVVCMLATYILKWISITGAIFSVFLFFLSPLYGIIGVVGCATVIVLCEISINLNKTLKAVADMQESIKAELEANKAKPKEIPSTWSCAVCGNPNFATNQFCKHCGAKKP